MSAARMTCLAGIALVVALVALLFWTWIHSSLIEITTGDVRANLEKNSSEALQQWAAEFVRNHPVPTNGQYAGRGERLTNGPLSAIRGVHPYVSTSKTEETDPLLVEVEWARQGAKLLIGTTNFHSTNSDMVLWKPGIYIRRGKYEPGEQ